MKNYEKVLSLLKSVGIRVSGNDLIIPENLNFPKALEIEAKIEELGFKIVDDQLINCNG